MVVWLVSMRCHIPPWREDQEVRKRRKRITGSRGEDAKDRRVDMVNGGRPGVHELRRVVLVGYVVSVPGYDIKRAVILGTLEMRHV